MALSSYQIGYIAKNQFGWNDEELKSIIHTLNVVVPFLDGYEGGIITGHFRQVLSTFENMKYYRKIAV
jgi:hypothetical protein